MKKLHRALEKQIAVHKKRIVRHRKVIENKVVKHRKVIGKHIARHNKKVLTFLGIDLKFAVLMLVVGMIILVSGAGSTGNFALSNSPQVFATADDFIYVYLGDKFSGNVPVVITSPDKRTMVISQNSPQKLIAKVSFAGQVLAIRDSGFCEWNLDTNLVKVENNLIGAAVDGTWSIASSRGIISLVSGYQIHIQGKTFDGTAAYYGDYNQSEPIDGCGTGEFGYSPKQWNWHIQPAYSRYDAASGYLNPIENPLYAKYYDQNFPSISTDLAQTSEYPDDFNADLTPPTANSNVFGLIDSNYYWATAPTRWVQYNPTEGAYAQTGGVMTVNGIPTRTLGSPLILNGLVWESYNARYTARSVSTSNFGSKPLGGFVVRFSDPTNFIAVQPSTNQEVVLKKTKAGGFSATNELQIEYLKTNGGWPEGEYRIEARGNRYTVYVNSEPYLIFVDTKSDYLTSQVGFYLGGFIVIAPVSSTWDNFRINRVVSI